jgi:hypothetical protein
MRKIFFTLFTIITFSAFSQGVNGYWYGTANLGSGTADNYLVEMVVSQNGTSVEAVLNYYFRNTFRSFKVKGNYNSMTRQFNLYNIPVTYYGSPASLEVDCPMDLTAQVRVSQVSSNMIGSFESKGDYKYTCPPVYFDLKFNKDASNKDSVLTALREYKETYQVWSPSGNDTLVAAVIQQREITNFVVSNQFKERENEVMQELEVESDSLRIEFYDNGEVDGDSISIFFNDKLLASSQRLSVKAIQLTVGLDSTKEINTLGMFADNLGGIPPNTALMLVYDGRKRHDIRLTSNLQKNGVVRIRRKK